MINERQKKLLEAIIKTYIELAQPVSSGFIQEKYDFGIRPAMIRREMQALTEKGFLYQPYSSAGRIPTDKGYRFFVNSLLEKDLKILEIKNWFEEGIEDSIKFIQGLTKNLAITSQVLTLVYLEREDIFWKEGWEEILREPEFSEKDFVMAFFEFLENLEKNIKNFQLNSGIKIYIGKENPVRPAKDFAVIASKCHLPVGEEIILSLVGPKRMAYDRNISLMNSLIRLLDKNKLI